MSTTAADASPLQHDIKLAKFLRAGDHVWNRGEVDRTIPESKRVMYVQFADGETLQYDPREKVLCDRD